jgi:hypothetical protein
LRPLLPVRRHPLAWLEGNHLELGSRTIELPPAYARLVALCDGERNAVSIAEELTRDESLEIGSVDDVDQMVEELERKKLVYRSLPLPSVHAWPERALRRELEQLGEIAAARRGLAALDELETARAAVERASGEELKLAPAIADLERVFERHAGTDANRRGGSTYGARTVFYEDCRRDLELSIGPANLARLSPPLTLMLRAARWFTHTIATRYRAALGEAYRELTASRGDRPLPYPAFAERALDCFSLHAYQPSAIVRETAAEMAARFAKLLDLDGSAAPVQRRSSELGRAFEELLAAPGPGWPSARVHAPDLLIAAKGIDSIARKDALFVFGELHVALNTQLEPLFWNQHPRPDELLEEQRRDFPEPRVTMVFPSELMNRVTPVSLARHDLDVEQGAAPSPRPRSQRMAAGELVVRERDGNLEVATRDGRHRFDVIEFFDQYLTHETANHFRVIASGPHTPRVTVDDLVIARETWRFPAEALAFAHVEPPLDRFCAAHRFRREHRLPRFAFARIPEEQKPMFVDFESPILVELLARLARKSSGLTVSEMLPSVDEAWLPDADGRRYVCELRLVAVDPEPWRRP